jgi:hypothetical protein
MITQAARCPIVSEPRCEHVRLFIRAFSDSTLALAIVTRPLDAHANASHHQAHRECASRYRDDPQAALKRSAES